LIYLDGVGKSYNGNVIVNDITLRLPECSMTAIIGPNNAGKSKLLAIMKSLCHVLDSLEKNHRFGLAKCDVIAVDGFAIHAQQKGDLNGCHIHTKAPYYLLLPIFT